MLEKSIVQRDCDAVSFTLSMKSRQLARVSQSLLTPRTRECLMHAMEHGTPTHRPRQNNASQIAERQCCWNLHLGRTGCVSRRTPLLPREAGRSAKNRSISEAGLFGKLSRANVLGPSAVDPAHCISGRGQRAVGFEG